MESKKFAKEICCFYATAAASAAEKNCIVWLEVFRTLSNNKNEAAIVTCTKSVKETYKQRCFFD